MAAGPPAIEDESAQGDRAPGGQENPGTGRLVDTGRNAGFNGGAPMQEPIPTAPGLDRRDFIRTDGGAAMLAALPSGLAAAAGGAPASPVTLALVGCAHIHTPSFVELLVGERPNVRVKLAWDHDAARAEKFAADLGAAVATSLQQVWSDPEVSAVVICSETNRHRELVLAAAASGKHIYA